ncbi:MAG TPA: cytochrome d ubiquinol oxidase subunit II [Solirubrobacteraceae bacterium]|jgi:cytochrome d ubiquinol oxidase subunit II|nr:cytochrome d ubiquinol oxidase subunit II [Solirubrobacteraceae bacterium]
MQLHTLWFIILAVVWIGFFVLEGFDFGVGVLHTIVGRGEIERRVALNTIGPFWDGNEVWLVVAGAGTFAAFPGWYATMFSALYLALLLVLAALMARGVAFEFRGKSENSRWRNTWTWCTTLGSLFVPLLLGVGLGDLLNGLPIDASHEYTGDFFDLLTPYGLWTGVTILGLCLLHGATFLMLKTTDAVRERARGLAPALGWAAVALVLGFVIWTRVVVGHTQVPGPVEVLALIAVVFAARLARSEHHEGLAFTASATAIAATIGSIFIDLYPNVMVSSTSTAFNLSVNNSASGHYALVVMSIVVVLFLPLVLAYQGWSFYVFRARVQAPPAQAE